MDINQHHRSPVAIIGIGCIFAKSPDLKAFLHLLTRGINGISDPPATHHHLVEYFDPDPKKPDHIYCNRGGFLPTVDFDPTEFNIPPNVIEATDTSQLLGLMTAKKALEDAGYGDKGRSFDRSRASVILGVTGTQELVIPLGARLGHPLWKKALSESGVPADQAEQVIQRISDGYVGWQENSFPGLLGNVVAGRIANRLDLGGTNCVVDAACASSMGAIHMALLELGSGRSDMVVTGGVDTINDAFMHMCFAKTQILSATGDIRPFSMDADGTVLGEGVGLVVLKRLEDAEKDGDRIYAVIKGLGSASDGKSQSIYAPRPEGQARALRRAYQEAGIDPADVGLVEAHGTGTRVGDQVEFQALCDVFGEVSPNGNRCALGSIKSNIGHTKAAAGSAGLIKAALSVYHKVLPPTLKAKSIDPKLGVEHSPFYINTQLRPWISPDGRKRKAGVSAFGFGGSNFHTVLEEYDQSKQEPSWDGTVEIAAFSGSDKRQLIARIEQWAQQAELNSNRYAIGKLAKRSRQEFQSADPYRLVMVLDLDDHAESVALTCGQALHRLTASDDPNQGSVFLGQGPCKGKLAFLFPGQGSQYTGMGRDLICCFPQSFEAFEDAAACLRTETVLDAYVYPRMPADHKDAEKQLRQTQIAQPALAAVSVGMLKALEYFGLEPHATCGHSFGELVALHAAGWMAQKDLWRLAADRGRLMAMAGASGNEAGAMLAVRAPIAEIENWLGSLGDQCRIVLANKNSPDQGVLSGTLKEIKTAELACKAKGWSMQRLSVAAGFHSQLVESAQAPFEERIQGVQFSPSAICVMSNTLGGAYPNDIPMVRSILGRQLSTPVDFLSNVQSLYEQGIRAFVEVGPKTVLTDLVRATLRGKDVDVIALDQSKGRASGILDLACALARLASLGFDVNLDRWEKPQSQPRKARMAIPLSGANYRSPQTDQNGHPIRRSARMPAKPSISAPYHPSRIVEMTQCSNQPPVMSEQSIKPIPKQKMDDNTKTALQNALATVQQGLASLQALQSQTAQAHLKFLETQAEASRTLQMMIQSTRQLSGSAEKDLPLNRALPHPAVSPVIPEPAETPTVPENAKLNSETKQAQPNPEPACDVKPNIADIHRIKKDTRSDIQTRLLSVVSQLTGYPIEMLGLEMDIESDLGIDSIKRVEILSALEEQMPDLPKVTPDMMGALKTLGQICDYLLTSTHLSGSVEAHKQNTPQTEPANTSQSEIRGRLIAIVGQLTGYPVEMLGLEMDIESDLGIDSIKRVEILSALEEQMPELPKVTPDMMGSLKTLGEICDYLSANAARPETKAGNDTEISPHPESAASKGEKTHQALIAIVSRLTGYPVEMLGLEMDIEADLGIDSIKRVEILSALEEQLPDLPKVTPDMMGSLKTLGEIIAYLDGPLPASSDSPTLTGAPDKPHCRAAEDSDHANALRIDRRIVTVQSLTCPSGDTLTLPADHFIGLAGTLDGLEAELLKALRARGLSAKPLSTPDQLTANMRLAGLVLFAPLDAREAFCWAKACAPLLNAAADTAGACFITVSSLDGAFGFNGGTIMNPSQGALAGLAKTASIEWPRVRCLALDRDPAWQDIPAIAKSLAEEISLVCCHQETEIGLALDRRVGFRLASAPLPELDQIKLAAGDVVLITGGGRGVTAEAAKALAAQVPCRLALLGRSPLPQPEPEWLNSLGDEGSMKRAILTHEFHGQNPSPREIEQRYRYWLANRQIQTTVDTLNQMGASARYFSVDVNDAASVQATMAQISREFGNLKAIIHGAGVLEDRLIVDKHLDQFAKVYDTKVAGLLNLLDGLGDAELNYLVLFSSVSARFGNQGQVDYAMANEVLNKIARQQSLSRPGCKVLSINWGPWDGGMVTPALKRKFLKSNVALIPPAQGASALLREMANASGREIEVILGGYLNQTRIQKPSGHPTDRTAATSVALSLTCKRQVNVADHPVLRSHLLDGRPVVPLALITEWLAHSALHANPGLALHGMDNIRLFTGIALDHEKRNICMLAGRANRIGRMYEVEVEIREDQHGRPNRIHSSAKAILTDHLPAAPPFEENGHFKTNGRTLPSLEEIYQRVLFHGQDLRGIQEIIRISESGITARLASAPPPNQWMQAPLRSRWIADPLILDCAFQMAIVWCHEQLGQVSLPSFAASYRQYCERFPRQGVRAVLEIRMSNEHKLKGDFTFLDEHKKVLAHLKGYEAIMAPELSRAFKAA